MKQNISKFVILSAIIIAVNLAGLFWIHHSLTALDPAIVKMTAGLSPNNINPDRIHIKFDRNIAPPEKAGHPEVTELFALIPDMHGKWVWQDKDVIEFLPEEPMLPGRTITIEPTESFKTATGMSIQPDGIVRLETVSLQLDDVRLIASDNRHITIELTFNQPVKPDDLLRHVSFYEQNEERSKLVRVLSLTKTSDIKQVIRFPRPRSKKVEFVINKNLTGDGAELGLKQHITRSLEITSGFSFLSSYTSSSRFEKTSTVTLRFSRTLKRAQALPEIKITPAVEDVQFRRSYNDLRLTGQFTPGKQYTITIPSILSADNDKTLGREISITVDIPDRSPGIRFTHRSGILSPRGKKTLDLKAVNVSGLKLSSWRVHENNLVSFLQRNDLARTSRFQHEKVLDLDVPRNETRDYAIELEGLIDAGPGIYSISAANTKSSWNSSRTLVSITDLAITCKKYTDGVLVWVTSLADGNAVAGATVKAISYNNQVLTTDKTNDKGVVLLKYPSSSPDGPIWVLTAQKNNDLSHLRPNDNQWMLDNVDQSGRAWPRSTEVMLYGERGVYRPGDLIHLTGIIRDKYGNIPPQLPLSLKIIRPDGRQVQEQIITSADNDQGVFHADFRTDSDTQTGTYTFNISYPGATDKLGSTKVFVEAFVPLRMEIKANTSAKWYGPEDTPSVLVTGRYLWDQPTADIPVKVTSRLRLINFRSDEHKDFQFGSPTRRILVSPSPVSGKLDNAGKAELDINLSNSMEPDLCQLDITATITEPGARSVSRNISTIVDKMDHHIGLKRPAGQLVTPGEPVNIEWISLSGRCQPVISDTLEMRLYSVEYDTVLRLVNNKRTWRSVEKLKEIKAQQIAATNRAQGVFEIIPPFPGHFRLVVSDSKTQSNTTMRLYACEGAVRQSLKMNDPEQLEIVTDKEKYLPGESAKVLVRSPLSGKMLITLETDRIKHIQVLELINNTAQIEIPLDPEMRGGAYISATVIRAINSDEENWLPHRAMGMKRIMIDHKDNVLPVTITAPAKTEPSQTVNISVKTAAPIDPNNPSVIHCWAVDEGILMTTNYQAPDLVDYFLQPKRPGVFTSDMFYRLLPDYTRAETITRIGAGGGRYNAGKLRRNPVPSKHREPNVIWNKTMKVSADGTIKFDTQLPELIGRLRLMAVAVDHDRYGKTQTPVIVTSNLIVEAALPRFAAPGDAFEIPVKLFNSTNQTITVSLETKTTGPLTIIPLDNGSIEVSPDKPTSLTLKARAINTGQAELNIQAKGNIAGSNDTLSAFSKASLPIRAATALHSEISLQTLDAGNELTLKPSASFISGTENIDINISSRPSVQLTPALEKLLSYPYGCAEQTTSRLFGLLYAPHILGQERADSISGMVQAGITRLWSMQTVSGGLSYWPGGTQPNQWASAYAAWCLTEAQNAGHQVDPRFTAELLKYIESLLQNTDDENNFDRNTKALLCHILSANNKAPIGWMNSLAEQKKRIDTAGKAHLAAAFYAAGQTDRAKDMLPDESSLDMAIPTATSGRLTTALQQKAVLLSVLMEIEPDHAMVVPIVRQIQKARTDGAWRSTLENSAVLIALSKYQLYISKEEPNFTGQVTTASGEVFEFDSDLVFARTIEKSDGPISITSAGNGKIYLVRTSEGLAKKGLVPPYNSHIAVLRKWLDNKGEPIYMENLKVGDLINIEIELESLDKRHTSNIAIVDALPAGMEVENPKLVTSAISQRPKGSNADHMEFLDDRVILFTSIGSKKKVFRYALRITTTGIFELPPIQASCMYDPAIASLGESQKITIK